MPTYAPTVLSDGLAQIRPAVEMAFQRTDLGMLAAAQVSGVVGGGAQVRDQVRDSLARGEDAADAAASLVSLALAQWERTQPQEEADNVSSVVVYF